MVVTDSQFTCGSICFHVSGQSPLCSEPVSAADTVPNLLASWAGGGLEQFAMDQVVGLAQPAGAEEEIDDSLFPHGYADMPPYCFLFKSAHGRRKRWNHTHTLVVPISVQSHWTAPSRPPNQIVVFREEVLCGPLSDFHS